MSYLITGATGAVGGAVVAQLTAARELVRAVTRDARKVIAGVETVVGDFTSGSLPAEAFDGVDAAFVFPAQSGVRPFLEQARRAGVGRVVVLSSLAAAFEHERDMMSPSALHHAAIEQEVEHSGIPATILRPGTFANNLLFWSHAIKNGNTVYGPYGASRQAPIHEGDIAAVAVTALRDERHVGQVYHMTGPAALSRVEQLQTIGGAIGRDLFFEEVSPEAFRAEMSAFMPDTIIKMLLDYWSDTVSKPDRVLSTTADVTGTAPRTLADWARDHAAAFSRSEAATSHSPTPVP